MVLCGGVSECGLASRVREGRGRRRLGVRARLPCRGEAGEAAVRRRPGRWARLRSGGGRGRFCALGFDWRVGDRVGCGGHVAARSALDGRLGGVPGRGGGCGLRRSVLAGPTGCPKTSLRRLRSRSYAVQGYGTSAGRPVHCPAGVRAGISGRSARWRARLPCRRVGCPLCGGSGRMAQSDGEAPGDGQLGTVGWSARAGGDVGSGRSAGLTGRVGGCRWADGDVPLRVRWAPTRGKGTLAGRGGVLRFPGRLSRTRGSRWRRRRRGRAWSRCGRRCGSRCAARRAPC
ncbi:hypothetical protein SAMN05660976_01962 [Nonomuraea pusilla]|uniref:Uncharacterized protein n=1 Tax=Nonomuraea pusilla TaxID=46177 RepID=A0A1H7N9W2_9ACTN|nr:hypothetical protein SAMN05660976_01962 [Nonomuraea pusilla]